MLECSINGIDIGIELTAETRLAATHGPPLNLIERTTCNYGLNPNLDHIASTGGMRIAAIDKLNEIRAVELIDHPYFIGTLYQPQLRSTPNEPHPIFVGLVAAAKK